MSWGINLKNKYTQVALSRFIYLLLHMIFILRILIAKLFFILFFSLFVCCVQTRLMGCLI